MALKLSKKTRSGGTVEYWRISPVVMYDIVGKTVRASVSAYVSADARNSDSAPVPVHEVDRSAPTMVTLEEAAEAVSTGDPRAALYGELKKLPFFSGYEDV